MNIKILFYKEAFIYNKNVSLHTMYFGPQILKS